MIKRLFMLFIVLLLIIPVTIVKGVTIKAAAAVEKPEPNSFWSDAEAVGIDMQPKLNHVQPTPSRIRDLRKFPYPYRAMFTFASDIDDTTPREFTVYHRFLNTKEMTPAGPGLGLDIGDTLWVYMGNNKFNKTDIHGESLESVMTVNKFLDPKSSHNANMIKHYFDAGWIDSMHTFGDFSRIDRDKDVVFSRQLAVDAWDNLLKLGVRPQVWINHGNEGNVQSFGAWNPKGFSYYQAGDDPKSPYYHTDLTIKNGVRFVWNSVGETEFGQESPIFPITLRDGQKIWGFHRYTHEIVNGGINWSWDPGKIGQVITKERLDELVQKQQYNITAQHFGGAQGEFTFHRPADVKALRMIAEYNDSGKILVARTARMLNYAVAQQFINYKIVEKNHRNYVILKSINDPQFGPQPVTLDKVRGLTFYVDNPEQTTIMMYRKAIPQEEIQINPADETGRKSISIKWFQPDTTDYSKTAPVN